MVWELMVSLLFRKISSQQSVRRVKVRAASVSPSVSCRPGRECSSVGFIERGQLFLLTDFITSKRTSAATQEAVTGRGVPPLPEPQVSSHKPGVDLIK